MKKVFCILMTFVCVFGLFGCGDGYTEVFCVTYTSASSTVSVRSRITITYENPEEITSEEYVNSEGFKVVSDYYISAAGSCSRDIYNKSDLKRAKKLKIGDYCFLNGFQEDYVVVNYKIKIKSAELNIISIKIIDSKTISIKNKDGTKTISTDYYEITYFD